MTRFAAPRDTQTRVLTAIAVGVIAIGAAALVHGWAGAPVAQALAIAVASAVVLLAWALAPASFEIGGDAVVVERPLRPVRIPLASVTGVSLLPERALRGAIRVGGSGGLFGWYGRYRSRDLGAFRLYASRRGGLVAIDTAGERFVLSPEPPDRFVEAVRARAALPEGAPSRPLGPGRPLSTRARLGLAALVAFVPLAAGAVFLGAFAFAPVGGHVGPDAVVVERRWARPVELPLASITSARILPVEDVRALRRTSGASLPDGAYGRFRSEALGTVQLYAWRRGPAVLLERAEGRVVLTPEDAARFAAEVEARLQRR